MESRGRCRIQKSAPVTGGRTRAGGRRAGRRRTDAQRARQTGGSRRAGAQAGIRSRFPLIPSQEKELKTGGSRGRTRARAGGETGGRGRRRRWRGAGDAKEPGGEGRPAPVPDEKPRALPDTEERAGDRRTDARRWQAGRGRRRTDAQRARQTGGSRRAGAQAGIRSRFPLIPSQEKELKTGGSRGRTRARAGGETGGRALAGGGAGYHRSRAEKAARLLCRMESRYRTRKIVRRHAPDNTSDRRLPALAMMTVVPSRMG